MSLLERIRPLGGWFAETRDEWVGAMRHCNEIVMVARSKRIVSKQNGSNRLICNPFKRGVE